MAIQITPEYHTEIAMKRALLRNHHERCFQSLDHTLEAQWEVVLLLTHQLAHYYPEHFSLNRQGNLYTFHNRLLNETQTFEPLNAASLPMEPLNWIGQHVQEDLLIMKQGDEHDEHVILAAGQLCFPGNWSLYFNLGMPFSRIHEPVPGLVDSGIADKIARFVSRIEAGQPWTRLNWSLNAGQRLDTSPETFDQWGHLRHLVSPDTVGTDIHLRVEEQNLFRLSGSNGLLFTIHTYLKPMMALMEVAAWRDRLHSVMKTLPQHLIEYKGIEPYYDKLLQYLEGYCDVQS
jgi:hypothetical protein